MQQQRRQISNGSTNGIRARDARITSLAQARRHHLRQQLTEEEQREFDEQYGDEADADIIFAEEEEEEADECEEENYQD